MKHIEPLAITAESRERLKVSAICDGEEVEYSFVFKLAESIPGMVSDDAFYFKTHDDAMAAFWLKQAVMEFQKAYESRVADSSSAESLQPVSIRVGNCSGDACEYFVTLRAANGEVRESNFSVSGSDTNYRVSDSEHVWDAVILKRQWSVDVSSDMKPILESILSLNKARDVR